MPVNRVQVIWTGAPIQGGGLSTFYFNSAVGTAAQQVSAVAAFLAATEARRAGSLGWVTGVDVATLNTGSGALENVTTTTQASGAGTGAGDVLGPTQQGLLRMLTSVVAGGRLLRGRLFLPGTLESDNGSTGQPSATFRTDYDTDAATLLGDANTDWSVWSQTHGILASVTAANTWNKWAVLRSRRD